MVYDTARSIYQTTLKEIRDAGLFKEERFITSPQGGAVNVRFPLDGPEMKIVNLCSNNYLGLSSHPDVIKAAHEGLDKRGYGMSSVRFICGTQDIHRELEKKVAKFLSLDDAILFGSCFDANGAVFEALLTQEDAIISDKLVHASLIDGVRLCKAQRFIFDHSNLEQLEEHLKSVKARIKLIVTDGVFSMDGDMARLDEICTLSEKYDAMVLVDDSHATGFIGKTGRGTPEHFNVMKKVDIITTTFGKALGGATGGCIAAHQEIIDLLKQRGRPYLFSNSLMPAVVTATSKVLDVLSASTERRDKLESLSSFWRKSLTEAGFDVKSNNPTPTPIRPDGHLPPLRGKDLTPIVPIMFYNAKLSQDFSRDLYNEGIYAVGFFYPVVQKGQARIRTQMSAALDMDDLKKALAVFMNLGKRYDILGKTREEVIAKYGE